MSYIIGNHIEDIVTKNPATVIGNRLQTEVKFNKGTITAFGNLVVADPFTVFEFDFTENSGNSTLFDSQVVTGATITSPTNGHPGRQLNVTSATGSKAVIQSFETVRYQKGKEQRIIWTNQLGNPPLGIRMREGYFNDEGGVLDGLYFQINENQEWSVNVASAITGTKPSPFVGDIASIPRSQWDDPLDGTGESGYNFDLSRFFLKGIRFSWLGTNLVQFGVLYDQEFVPCHTFNFGGVLLTPYMKSPHHPFRFEVENINSTSSHSMIPTCGNISSMGGREEYFTIGATDNDNYTTMSSGEYRILLLLRLNSGHLRSKVESLSFNSNTDSNGAYRYTVWRNPTFSAPLTEGNWIQVNSDSFVDYYNSVPTAPFITTGTKLISEGVTIANNVRQRATLPMNVPIRSNLAGVSDILAFTVNGTNNNSQFASAQWREYR